MSRISTLRFGMASMMAVALAAVGSSQQANAALVNTDFNIAFSPSPRVLGAIGTPQYDMVAKDEMCDNPLLRIFARNKPGVLIANDPTSDAPITSFTLSIQNPGTFVFGTGDFATDNFTQYIKQSMFTDPGVNVTGSSVSDGGKTLTVNFSGLTAGKKAIFCIDLDTTDNNAYPFPDFREVLFGAPMSSNSNPTAPATFSVTFTDPVPPNPTKTIPGVLEQVTEVPQWHDMVVRPYHAMDPIEVLGGGVVPEPTTAALALVGLLAVVRRRS